MGQSSDLFTCPEAELTTQLVEEGVLRRDFPAVEGKGLFVDELVRVVAILLGSSEEAAYQQLKPAIFDAIRGPKRGSFAMRLPDKVVERLCAADDSELLELRCAVERLDEAKLKADPMLGVIPLWFDEVVAICKTAAANRWSLYLLVAP